VSVQLERLTFVHNGDQGTIGRLIAETKGLLRFGSDGSGLFEIGVGGTANIGANIGSGPGSVPAFNSEAAVRITSVSFTSLPPEVRGEIGAEQVPCLLGHSGVLTVPLLSSRSCARVSPSLSDLRGKVRFALARIGWEL
jgi:hypothetical protein